MRSWTVRERATREMISGEITISRHIERELALESETSLLL